MQYHEIYRGLENRYGQFKGFGDTNPKTGKKTKECTVPYGNPPYQSHLEGKDKIGIYPFTSDKNVAWGCIDVDDYTIDIPGLAKQVHDLGLPGVITRSTNGGAHIWFIFVNDVNAKQLRNKLKDILDLLGLDPKTEIFPKQDDIDIKGGTLGNFVFLPYYNGAKGLNYAIDHETGTAIPTVEEFEKYVEANKLDSINEIKVPKNLARKKIYDDMRAEAVARAEMMGGELLPEYQDQDLELKDFIDEAPPCLRSILDIKGGFADEGRNNALYGYAVLSKKAKGKAVKKDLEAANKTFQTPIEDRELNTIVKSVNSKDYQYKCKDIPLETYCAKDECLMMKFGIGTGAKEKSYFDDFVYVKEGSKVIKLKPTLRELDLIEAKNQMNSDIGKINRGSRNVPAGEVWHFELSKRNSVDVIKWHPGKPLFYEEPGDNGTTVRCINTYRPTTRIPLAGDPEPFITFMKARIKDDKVREWVFDRIAFLVQYPGKRCPAIMLLVSDDGGTGKSIIDLIFVELFGRHNISNIDIETFSAGWSDFFKNKLWVTVEEVSKKGSQRADINAALKRWSSIKWSTNNIKFGKISKEPDEMFCNFYCNTNSNTAMTIKDGDRRLLIYKFDNDKEELRQQNSDEGIALYNWCEEENGYEIILNFFKTRDISKFKPFDWPPQTNARQDMILKTSGWKFKQIYEAWQENRWPFFPGIKIYAPYHLADLFEMDREECLTQMQKYMGIKKCIRAQNIQWARVFDGGNKYDHSHSPEDVILWTSDESLQEAQKKGIRPKEITKQYLHPVKDKTHGHHFVQDKVHREPLVQQYLKEALGEEYHPDRNNTKTPF